ncbi:hypothetical protein GW17_00002323 [Ensete ventricosum]|nr:hypothetical protein GW17_00002323 [Ensete ventricosum]
MDASWNTYKSRTKAFTFSDHIAPPDYNLVRFQRPTLFLVLSVMGSLKAHPPLAKPLLLSPSSLRVPAPLSCSLPIIPKRPTKLRCEFELKGNGALPGDADPRAVDRVSSKFSVAVFLCVQLKALEAAMNDINSSFGRGSVTRLGSAGGALVYVLHFPCPF